MFNVGSVQGYLKLNTTGWTAPMRTAGMQLQTLSRSFTRMGVVAVGSLLLIEREFGRFDKAIRHATSVSETTAAQFSQMSEMALDASVRWNKAATETAQAFYFLGSAGLTVTEQMQAFNDTIMLSRAMGSSLSQTVEGMVDIVKAFGLEFANSREIADQLTKTVITSNQVFGDLEQALSYGAASARQANNTLAETAAMLGVMANAGIKGSMAGTVLRRAMTNLMSPTGDMAGLIYELGLQVYDTTGRMKPFITIMGDISEQIKNTSDEYKNMVFEVLFGRRAISGQIQLFNFGAEALKKYAAEIQNAGGTTERVADKQMKAFTEVLGRLWRQIQRVAIITGETLAPSIEALSEKMRGGLIAFTAYIEKNKEAITHTLKWAAALSAVLVIGLPLLTLIANLGLQMVAIASILLNPWVALITILYVVRAVWAETFGTGGELSKSLDEFTIVLKNWLTYTFGIFGEALIWIGAKTIEGWSAIFNLISGLGAPEVGMPSLGTQFGDVVDRAKTLIKAISTTVKNQLKQDIGDMGGIVAKQLPMGMKDAYNVLRELLNLFLNPPEVKKVLDALPEAMKTATAEINETTAKATSEWATRWRNAVRQVIDSTENWHDSFVDALTDIRSQWALTMQDYIKGGMKLKTFIENMFLDVLNAFNRMMTQFAANRLFYEIFGGVLGEAYKPKYGAAIPGVKAQAYTPPEISESMGRNWGTAQKPVPVSFVLENKGEPMVARKTAQHWDGKQWVINVMLEAFDTDPNVRARLAGG